MATTSSSLATTETDVTPKTYLNYIGGEWRPSVSGETFDNTNPAHRSQVLGRFQKSVVADVDAALAAAESALPAWRAMPAPTRGEIILRAALILERDRDRLARQMTQEMGKPLKETQGDLQTAIDFGKFVFGEGRRAEGETVPSALVDKMCFTLRQPLGVVGIITPWNFPMAI
ncbi:MAG TPA: aldehyde dehydrogenase family protein, partial [Ktedonobacterales bacterium]